MGQEKKEKDNGSLPRRIIETAPDLAAFAGELARRRRIAVDLEADSMFHFKEKVCLVQIATADVAAVIDPLILPDLSALAPVFADPAVQKVLHGADYDVRSLHRDFGIEIQNLFDTQIASRFLGMAVTGLDGVLSHHFGVSLDKRFQKKDWSKRPLPQEMIDYAASDTLYLLDLARRMEKDLADLGRLEWVREECENLAAVRYPVSAGEPLFLRFKGAGRLRPRSLAILEALLRLRMEHAEKKDRPPFKIFGNSAIEEIVKARPGNLARLAASNALSEKQIRMYGEDSLAAVALAMAIPEEDLPAYPRQRPARMSPKVPERVRMLREWRDKRADALGLDPSLVLSKSLMHAVAALNPESAAALSELPELGKWRVAEFGEEIVQALAPPPARRKKRRR